MRIPIAALFALFLACPRGLPAQASGQLPAARAPPAPETAVPAHTAPTAEQLGDSFTARQRYQAAIAAYSKAPEMTATIWNKMGIDYQMMFNSKDAARCYKQSIQLDPSEPQVLNNLATVYASLKEYGQADRLYRRALKIDPQSALILKNLGTNLLAEHKYNKGWDAYQQALAIDPEIFSNHDTPSVDDPSSAQGARRDELLHGGWLRPCRLRRLRSSVSPHGARRGLYHAQERSPPTLSSPVSAQTQPLNS